MNRIRAQDIVISRAIVSLSMKSYAINESALKRLYSNSKRLNYKNEEAFEQS